MPTFFQNGDSVSIHTLAWAAHDILEKHPKTKKSGGSLVYSILEKSPDKAKAHTDLHKARNFFKHYHKAPRKKVHFIENMNEWLLLDCASMYLEITGKQVREGYGMANWIVYWRNYEVTGTNPAMNYLRENHPSKAFLDFLDSDRELAGPSFV